jgi:hypothetical protein
MQTRDDERLGEEEDGKKEGHKSSNVIVRCRVLWRPATGWRQDVSDGRETRREEIAMGQYTTTQYTDCDTQNTLSQTVQMLFMGTSDSANAGLSLCVCVTRSLCWGGLAIGISCYSGQTVPLWRPAEGKLLAPSSSSSSSRPCLRLRSKLQ